MNIMKSLLLSVLCLAAVTGCGQRTVPYRQMQPPMMRQAPMGNPGMYPSNGNTRVWVNLKTHVYHYPGSRAYGGTKYGRFESEQQAVAEGNRPAANNQ